MRIKHAAVLIAIGWTFATPAVGQDDCLASFAVNPSKSVTYLSIGPNPGDRIDTMMSCSIAERMRNEFFLTGKTIDRNLLGNAGQLMSKILEIKMRLASHKQSWREQRRSSRTLMQFKILETPCSLLA